MHFNVEEWDPSVASETDPLAAISRIYQAFLGTGEPVEYFLAEAILDAATLLRQD